MEQIIAHLDMDAFFASVEEVANPRLSGLPIVVGSDPKEGKGRGVVSTANYKAREYGIHSATPISIAWKLSKQAKDSKKPEAVFLPVDFSLYERVSERIYNIIKKYSNLVEPASIDEFYFSAQGGPASGWDYAIRLCKKIKKEIKDKEKLTCSIGLAKNKLIAKISAGQNKPNGLTVVLPEFSEEFLNPLPIRKLPGVGPKTEEFLKELGINFVKDLKGFSEQELKDLLGKWGQELYFKARGQDNSQIVTDYQAKSIGEQATFNYDTLSALVVGEKLNGMCQRVFERFLQSNFDKFKTIAVTIRFFDFKTQTCSKSFTAELGKNDLKKLQTEALRILLPYLDKRKNPNLKKLRLIGIRIENLSKIRQKQLGV